MIEDIFWPCVTIVMFLMLIAESYVDLRQFMKIRELKVDLVKKNSLVNLYEIMFKSYELRGIKYFTQKRDSNGRFAK